ncbi:MAG: type IV secretion protein Rhs [Prevotellaceae bacterium]|nr:type IV secretion protein Rhs [Prevotellaceae bacterium]
MEQWLNPVRPKVRFDGEEILFESLTLDQDMNSCHRFEVVKEFMSQDAMWKETPQKLMEMIGARALIRFEHIDSGRPYEFSGWVTDVRIEAWEDGMDGDLSPRRSNRVHFIGQGDVVSLEGTPTMNSFVDSQLSTIVSSMTENSLFEVKCNPRYQGVLPFAMQYAESNFAFLCRLASLFGEMFFYDGRDLFFGAPDDPRSEYLNLDQDIQSMRTCGMALPRMQSCYAYLPSDDVFVCKDGGAGLPSDNPLLKLVVSKSDRIFPDKGISPTETSAYTDASVSDMVNAKQSSVSAAMLVVEGETRTCRLRLGGWMEIGFPDRMKVPSLGKYRIISLHHHIDKNGNYTNRFRAMPAEVSYFPCSSPRKVVAYPEVAVVSDNKDPESQGRVQVRFDWQKSKWISTNWIRVQTPDAGTSQNVPVNRGLVAVPEVGDQVMVGFEYGDPNRPFVMGSLFSGKTGEGGGPDNQVRSIRTKSGHQIVFNDGQQGDWGITISDKSGNTIRLDTNGKNIEITAAESLSLLANNICIAAGEGLTINAGKDIFVDVDENMRVIVGENAKQSAKNMTVDVSENEIHKSEGMEFTADKIRLDSTKQNLELATGKNVDVQSKSNVNLF